MHAYEQAVGAFAEGINSDGGERGLQRPGVIGTLDQDIGEGLERVQPQLVHPLALDEHPVVVPTRQQLTAEAAVKGQPGGGGSKSVRLPWVQQSAGTGQEVHHVYPDVAPEPDLTADGIDEPWGLLVQSPKSRADARLRPLLARLRPEGAAHESASLWSAQRKKCHQALAAHRDMDATIVSGEAPAVE